MLRVKRRHFEFAHHLSGDFSWLCFPRAGEPIELGNLIARGGCVWESRSHSELRIATAEFPLDSPGVDASSNLIRRAS